MKRRQAYYFLSLLFLPFVFSACCDEIDTHYMWKIVNNSTDTLVITFTNRNDSIVILPQKQFGQHQNTEFACGSNFIENTYTVHITGNRTLQKALYAPNNWESELSKRAIYCDQMRKCVFTISDKDIQ